MEGYIVEGLKKKRVGVVFEIKTRVTDNLVYFVNY